MLMNEIASAADTLELWKMVNDKVWDSLQQLQRDEQARKAAEKKAAAKRVPRKRSSANKPQPSRPQAPPPPKAPTSQPTVPQQMARLSAVKPQPPVRYGLQPQPPSPQNTAKPM